ncbi:sugar phosphate nucleotidyltransferase [Nanoarchaeota archaeon]
MKALILAGGFGTRLKEITKGVPKPMAPIAGKPFLHHQIRLLREQGITDIVLAVHYMSDKIKAYFGNGKRHGVDISYAEEEMPLGTGGAIRNAKRYLGNNKFAVFNGDTYTGMSIKNFNKFHEEVGEDFSMAVTSHNEPEHHEIIEIKDNMVKTLHERGKCPKNLECLINSGAYLLEPNIFDYIEEGRNISLEKEVFPRIVGEGKLAAYKHTEYFIDIGRPETYKQFKKEMVNAMLMKKTDSIRSAMKRMDRNEEGLVFIVDENEKLTGIVTPHFINSAFINGKTNLEDKLEKVMLTEGLAFGNESDSPEKIAEIMLPRTNRLPILNSQGKITDIVYRQEVLGPKESPTYRAISPLRISFSGGGTDKEDYFTRFGTGVVINATIDKYCHATTKLRHDKLISINPGGEDEELLDLKKEKFEYNGRWDLAKAVVKVMNPDFGFDLHAYNDVPPGRGLGSSGSFAVMLTELIGQMRGEYLTNDQIAKLARKAEIEELKIKGGWQDQYAAKVGGFNLMEFSQNKITPSSLALSPEVVRELEESLLLCYIGKTHNSGEIHAEQEKNFQKDEKRIRGGLEKLTSIATIIRDSLVSKNPSKVGEIGNYLHEAWLIKKGLSGSISNNEIDDLYNLGLKNGATGGKLLGAGNGGYLLFFSPPERKSLLEKELYKNKREIMKFHFERQPAGTQVWPVY